MPRFDFNPADRAGEVNQFKPIPEGEYRMKCVEADEVDTSKGGKMIKGKFEVARGEMTGRKVFHNFNTENENAQAVEIAQRDIAAWIMACGKDPAKVRDTDELLECEFDAKVSIEDQKKGYGPQNRMRFVVPDEAVEAAKAGAGAGAPASGAATGSVQATSSKGTAASTAPKAAGAKKSPWE